MNQPAEPGYPLYPADEPAAPGSPAQPIAPHTPAAPAALLDPAAPVDTEPTEAVAPEATSAKRRRWPVVVPIVLVLALVLSGAGFFGLRAWYGWGATEPEQVLPADVAAFARIDLDPGYRDQLAVAKLLKKFPAGKAKGATGAVESVERSLFQGTGLDFEADVKPWFAKRAGVALWLRDGKPVPVLALASSDDTRAKAALAKIRASTDAQLGYAFRDGYALVVDGTAGGQQAADAVAAAAASSALADDSGYRAAVKKLRDNSIAIGYTDLAKAGKAAAGLAAADQSAATGLGQLTGTVVAGAAVVDEGVEVLVRGSGLPAGTPAGSDLLGALGSQPGDAMLALSAAGSAGSGADLGSAAGGLLTGQLGGLLGLPGDTTDPGADQTQDPELAAAITQQMQAFMAGLTSAVQALVTAKMVSLAISGVQGDTPRGVVDVQARDAEAAGALAALRELLPLPGLEITQNGTEVKATLGGGGSGGSLADSALYHRALAGAPGNASLAAYVDVTKLLAGTGATADTRAQWAPVQAIGLALGTDKGDLTGMVRVVIR